MAHIPVFQRIPEPDSNKLLWIISRPDDCCLTNHTAKLVYSKDNMIEELVLSECTPGEIDADKACRPVLVVTRSLLQGKYCTLIVPASSSHLGY